MTHIYKKELTDFEIAEREAFIAEAEQRAINEARLKNDREKAILKLKSIGLTESEVEALLQPL